MPQDNSNIVIGFAALADHVQRPAHALRAAHSIGLLPIRSEMQYGNRCFNGNDVQILADLLRPGVVA